MILTSASILNNIKDGNIYIDPFKIDRLNPNSYNLSLSNKLFSYDDNIKEIDLKAKPKLIEIIIPETGLLLKPNKLYLGKTNEYTETKNLVPMLDGRSSIGRLGLSVHLTASLGSIGFKGFWTLEIFCVHPVRIYPDIEICQIYYNTVEGDITKTYNGKYQNNSDIQPSLLYREF